MSNSQSEQQIKGPELEEKRVKQIMELARLRAFMQFKQKQEEQKRKEHEQKKEEEMKSNSWRPFYIKAAGIAGSYASFAFVKRFWSLRYMIQPKNHLIPKWNLTNYKLLQQKFLQEVGKKEQVSKGFKSQSIDDKIKREIKLSQKLTLSRLFKREGFSAFTLLRSQLQWLKFIRDHHIFSFYTCLLPLALPGIIWMPGMSYQLLQMGGYETLYWSFGTLFEGLYLWGVYPFLKYCKTRGIPTVVFDDANVLALHDNPKEVDKCSQFYCLMLDRLANVHILSSDPRTSTVLQSMPNARDIINHYQIEFDPNYTYDQILKDQGADFIKMKSTFLKDLLAHKDYKKSLTNEVIKYFIIELKDRQLTLRELEAFFDNKLHSISQKMFKAFVSNRTLLSEMQSVKKVCEMYDHHLKDKMTSQMNQIQKLYENDEKKEEKKEVLKSFINSLGVEAQKANNESFEKRDNYLLLYDQLIERNILRQDKKLVRFESKMKKIAFKLWFLEGGLSKKHLDHMSSQQNYIYLFIHKVTKKVWISIRILICSHSGLIVLFSFYCFIDTLPIRNHDAPWYCCFLFPKAQWIES